MDASVQLAVPEDALRPTIRRCDCVWEGDRVRVVHAAGAGEPVLRPGDDLITAVGAVGRAGSGEQLRRWIERLRESGTARAQVRVALSGGRRAVLVITGVCAPEGERLLVALELLDGSRAGAVAVDGELDLRTAVERLNAVYYELELDDDGNWALQYASPQWEVITGIPLPDNPAARSRAWLAMIHPDDAQGAFARFEESLASDEPIAAIYRIVRPDGGIRWVREQFVGFGGTAARPRLAGVTTDITDQRLSDDRLRRVVAGVRGLLLEMAAGIGGPDRTRSVLSALIEGVDVPPAGTGEVQEVLQPARLSGLGVMNFRLCDDGRGGMSVHEPSPTLLGFLGGLPDRVLRVVHPEDRRRVLADVGRLALGAGEGRIAFRVIREGGGAAWVRLSLDTRSRHPLDVAVTVLDITSIVDAAPSAPSVGGGGDPWPWDAAEGLEDIVLDFATDDDVRLRYVSPSANAVLGTPGLEPPPRRAAAWMDAVHPGDLAALVADVRAAATSDGPVRGAHRLRRPDGGVRWVRTVLRAAADGGVTGVAGDITDLMSREHPGEGGAEPPNPGVSRLQAGVWDMLVLDPVTRVVRFTLVSRPMWDVLGVPEGPPDEFAEVLQNAIHTGDRASTAAFLGHLLDGRIPLALDYRVLRPDGEVRWVRVVATGMTEGPGERRISGTLADVTAEIEAGGPPEAAHPGIASLTRRQRQILDMLASGAGTDDMARALGIRPVTVANHVAALLRRLGVRSRIEAVALANGAGARDPRASSSAPPAQ